MSGFRLQRLGQMTGPGTRQSAGGRRCSESGCRAWPWRLSHPLIQCSVEVRGM